MPWLVRLYYVLVPAFVAEQVVVFRGMRAYKDGGKTSQGRRARLTRYTHTLEKGLISRPRREIFALDCIKTVVGDLVELWDDQNENEPTLQWSADVLATYFQVVESHPIIDRARALYEEKVGSTREVGKRSPFSRDLAKRLVSYAQFNELCHYRRSTRWFLPTPVPRDVIDQAIIAAGQSPSACNRQPFFFWVMDDPDIVRRFAGIPGGTKGFSQNFVTLIAVIGDLSCYYSERDRHVIYIDGSLAAMTFVLALETLGIASCIINWPDVAAQDRQATEVLPLKPWQRIIMLIAVGYADPTGMVPFSGKKPIEKLRRYNLE